MERLLATAVQMLAQSGASEFTLQELSQRTKVSIGSIYLRFHNKQELIREVQIRFLDRVEREHALLINRLRRRGLHLRQLVPIAIREYCVFLRKHADLLRVFMDARQIPDNKIMWYVILHLTFVVSAVLLGVLDKISFAAHRKE